VFLAASLLVVIAAALATAGAGLSPIVGALIAGLLIAETEYHGEVEAITAPFKGLALGVFLITIGMSIDLAAVWQDFGAIVLATAGVLLLKAVVTGLLLRMMGARSATATEAGILMSSPSETTLIVLTAALSAQLISADTARFWQTVTALGMTITPLLALAGRRLARTVDINAAMMPPPDVPARHAIIVGFGRVGRLIADMLASHDQPYVAVDSDADLIHDGLRSGYSVVFGDAARGDALERLGTANATALILTMDEPIAAQRLVKKLRGQYPDLPRWRKPCRARDAGSLAATVRGGAGRPRRRDGAGHRLDPRKA
jgi:monovalent cation:H+ antiporter-2, CPA2 family